jgi:hypothetical protein
MHKNILFPFSLAWNWFSYFQQTNRSYFKYHCLYSYNWQKTNYAIRLYVFVHLCRSYQGRILTWNPGSAPAWCIFKFFKSQAVTHLYKLCTKIYYFHSALHEIDLLPAFKGYNQGRIILESSREGKIVYWSSLVQSSTIWFTLSYPYHM